MWLSESDRVHAIRSEQWQQITLQAPARGDGWQLFAERFQQRWGQTPGLLEASAYDTARLLALAAGGDRDQLEWIDPEAEPISLCAALTQRQAGESLRIPSAASDFRLRAGQAPGGQALAGLVKS